MSESEEKFNDLVPVHGGLEQPVDRRVALSERKAFLKEAAGLPEVRVSNADLSTVHRIADGALSPLEGPMAEGLWHAVLEEKSILRDGKRYAWTIPLSLPATDEEASSLSEGGSARVVDETGEVVALLDDVSSFVWDKSKYIHAVYGTERFDHPGGESIQADSRNRLVGGSLRALPQSQNREYGEVMLSPSQTRNFISDRKWERALAFQTRTPLHRAGGRLQRHHAV